MPVYNRLTDRSQVSAVTVDDIFHVVVTGDTSQSPQGSSYFAPISFLQPILSGASGTHGTSGTSGTSGSSGSSGSSGTSGSNGTSGSSGSSGSSGTSGSSGSSGSAGTSGTSPLPSQINTVQNTGNTKFYITFVDSNNLVATAESLYTNTGISYNPSTDILELITGYQSGDGSVSAPPYSFIADTNTGIYRIGTDNLGVATGGVRRMSVDSTGRILMGNGDETSGANFIFPLGAYVQTSNATPTTLLTLATVTDAVYTVEAFVAGGRDSGVNAIGGVISATFINDSGVLGIIGTVQGSVQENFAAAPTFTLTTSGTNIILQVTGVVGININWYGKIKYITGSFVV